MNFNQSFGQRTKNNKFHTYNMWQDSQYFDSSNFDLQRSYQEFRNSEKSESHTEPEIARDYKNRRIISRSSLHANPDSFRFHDQVDDEIDQVNKETNTAEAKCSTSHNDWKSKHSLKGNETITNDEACSSQPNTPTRRLNSLEKKLDKFLSQPIHISKAESMMQRMGWKGGALGKEANGILEPIAPNATYAISNVGLGHKIIERKPPKEELNVKFRKIRPTKKQLKEQPKFDKIVFITNVLLTIWDFVRNNRELEIVFESKVTKFERKSIHQLTDYLNEGEMIFDTLQQMDIAQGIGSCNVYKLSTESEGMQPNRSLCLFKCGKDHMYLVTPYEFQPEDPNDSMSGQENSEEIFNRNKKLTQINKSIAEKIYQTNKNDNKQDVKQNKAERNRISPKNVALNSVIDQTADIKDETEVDTTNPFLASITRHISNKKNDTKAAVDKAIVNQETVAAETTVNKAENTIKNIAEKRENVEKVEVENTICDKSQHNTTEKNKLEVKEKLTDTEKQELLLEYFTEFCETEDYTEFRFCGAFDVEEEYMIDKFHHDLKTCLAEPRLCGESFPKAALVEFLGKNYTNLEVTEDDQGNTVIYKKQKKRRLDE